MRILVVDDNPTNRKILRLMLEAEGHRPIEAANGVEALEKLASADVDAVISDVLMPKMDGYRFCYEVRSNVELRGIPIVIYSATYTSRADEDLATRVGADRFVRRPAPSAAILEALGDAVRSRKSVRREPPLGGLDVLKEYSDRLVLELEKKNLELESAKDLLSDAYDALRVSEKRYRDLVDQSPIGIYQTTPDGRFLSVNAAFAAMLGYASPQEVLHLRSGDTYINAPDREAVLDTFDNAERVSGLEVRLKQKDGAAIWLRVDGRAVRDFAGNVERYEVFAISISEQRKAEQALRASEERYRELVDFSPMGIFETTPGGRFLSANAAFASLLGYSSPQEVLALRAEDLYFDTSERDRVLRERDRLLHARDPSGRIQAFETRLKRKDGLPVWVRGDVRGVFDADGQIQRFDAFVVDVTEQRYALDALRASEERYRVLMDRAQDAIHVVDPNGIVLEANQAAERLTGRTKAEIVGRSFLDFVAPQEREEVGKRFEASFLRGGTQGEATRVVRPDGTTVDIEISASVIEIGGRPLVLAILRDISEQNALAEQLRLSQKMEAVGQLAGGVAHDFNNLLTAILGYSQLLGKDLREQPQQFAAIEEIRKAGERAAGLTRQLLAFSRKQMLEPKVLDLNEIVHRIHEMLSRLIGEDIEIVMNLDPALGSVRADAGQIEQVIMNLAVNARDAMPKGGRLSIETANVDLDDSYVQTHVHVQPGPYVMLAISDTGLGMDEATRQRIFEPFFTTKEKGRGTGLGLSTAYGIVKQSGGYIWVYTEPGTGTTFKIYLPRVAAPADPLPVAEPMSVSAGGKETILVVEDERSVRALVRKTLESKGYTVLEAEAGVEAVEIARTLPVNLVLTDMVLPGIGGSEIAARILEIHPDVKVLYTSGYTDDAIVRRGLLERGAAFIEKPFTPNALARRVREILDS
jgi:PAS domain S-box-containing protein